MGSIGHDGGAVFPATKLPLFNTTTRTSAIRSYHKATAQAVPIVLGTQPIRQRFARFIIAVTNNNEATFIAHTGREKTLVQAALTSALDLTQSPYTASTLDAAEFGFCIYTSSERLANTDSISDLPPHPLILSVCLKDDESQADITLCLRGDHGPFAAAQHLLQLALAYIGPEISLEDTGLSRITVPFPSHKFTENSQLPPPPKLLHSILEQSVHSYPHNIAIDAVTGGYEQSYQRREVTYSELHTMSSTFADQIETVLHSLDWPIFKGDQRMVPLFLSSCIEYSMCMNGISRVGHAFCALPMDAPEERLRDLLGDLHAPGILGMGENPWVGTKFGEEIIWIDCLNPMACLEGRSTTQDGRNLVRRTTCEDDISYMVYTSGSTGKPKGVLIPHRSILAYIRAFEESPGCLPMGPRLRWMAMVTPTFDVTLMDNFMPLLKGGTVCMAERNLLLTNPEGVIAELRATATFMVSSLALLLRPERVPTLTALFVGGEVVGQRVLDDFSPKHSDEQSNRFMMNLYGPTETTILASGHVCDSTSRPSIVGVPFPGTDFIVLDTNSPEPRMVPLGTTGELAIGGWQLSPGYHNRPEETEKAFIQTKEFGALYKTGDRVRIVWSEDGKPRIDFLGRISSGQVKLNGRRVELPEIENVLSAAQDVVQVTVLVHRSKLLACVMPWDITSDAATIEGRCRAEAERYLPAWMRPLHYIIMEKLPRTVSGKTDRKALQALVSSYEITGLETNVTAVISNGPPVAKATKPDESITSKNQTIPTDIDEIVYKCLAHALGDNIQIQDRSTDLAGMGLDSLRSLVFLQKIRSMGIKEMDLQMILSAATVGDLIETVQQQQSKEANPAPVSVPEVPKIINDAPPATTASTDPDSVDVSVIAADDEEMIYDLSLEDKLRHFDYHCRKPCLEALGLQSNQVEQVYPVTNVQARFIAMAVDPAFVDNERYVGRPHVEHFPYQVPSDMDPARLQRAIDTVLPRYDCFRTVFVPISHPLSPWAQCILSPSAGKIPRVEIICDDTDAENPESLWRQTICAAQRAAEAAMPINRPSVTVTYVWSQDRSRCVFILSLFHAIYDGTQLTYLRDAIAAEYAQPGSKPPVDLLPIRTAVEISIGSDWVKTMVFWAGRLAGVPGGRMGSRRPLPITELPGSYTGMEETHMRLLNAHASMTMRELSEAAARISMGMLTVVEAAWASVLGQTFSDQARADATAGSKALDVQFGTVLSGRRTNDALRCMAPMMAALPMRLLVDGTRPMTNRETCAHLAAQRMEAQPYLQIPCPTLAHARAGANRLDTVLLVQAHAPEDSPLRELPGYNFQQNLLAPYKEIDIGYPVVMELWPGRQSWDEKILLRCMYNVRRPGYEYINRDWIHGALSALDEAIVRIVSEPDAPFYTG